MEKVKEFLKNPKKTAILGLISSVIILCYYICYNIYMHIVYPRFIDMGDVFSGSLRNIISDPIRTALIIYFIIVLMRFYKKKGNIKVANYILITGFIIGTVLSIMPLIDNINISKELVTKFNISIRSIIVYLAYLIIHILTNILFSIYFINILIRRKTNISNKIVVFVALISLVLQTGVFSLYYKLNMFNDILIPIISYMYIPYFYNYYNILKGAVKIDE